MAKYYVKYRNKMLITDQKDAYKAAICMLYLMRSFYVSSNEYIFVDERGFRTIQAEYKFDVNEIMNYILKDMMNE